MGASLKILKKGPRRFIQNSLRPHPINSRHLSVPAPTSVCRLCFYEGCSPQCINILLRVFFYPRQGHDLLRRLAFISFYSIPFPPLTYSVDRRKHNALASSHYFSAPSTPGAGRFFFRISNFACLFYVACDASIFSPAPYLSPHTHFHSGLPSA